MLQRANAGKPQPTNDTGGERRIKRLEMTYIEIHARVLGE